MIKNTDDSEIVVDAHLALSVIRWCQNPSASGLCHGDLGNLDVLQAASKAFPENLAWPELLKAQSLKVLESFNRYGCKTSLHGHLQEPGLMIGLAGIGYGFLRLACAERVPSILLLSAI